MRCRVTRAIILLSAAGVLTCSAQTFTTLFSFDSTTGGNPPGPLAQDAGGNLVGATASTLFKLSGDSVATLFYFQSVEPPGYDGEEPQAPLTLGNDGSLYGACETFGPAGAYGSLFKITPSGSLMNLLGFNDENGASPNNLALGNDGNFYGSTSVGGPGAGEMGFGGYGTLFKITPGGVFTSLHNFDGSDGSFPSPLTPGNDGNFYGATSAGGANDMGTIFQITPSGNFTTIYTFDGTNGSGPGTLTLSNEGSFYGAAGSGGANGSGTIFKITPQGAITTLHNFSGLDGTGNRAALIQSNDGDFYGTTYEGGAANAGTLFKMTPKGILSTVHTFLGGADGANPRNGLTQDTNGRFYGTTYTGGSSQLGTIFSLDAGLRPFVKLQAFEGAPGRIVEILGQGLEGTTEVLFNGTAAPFQILSHSFITATVPVGATTGQVTVMSRSGLLISNRVFIVVP